ncbi:GNAT family N-acetyltransferase [Methylomonas sp. MK1]|uniref:GNAT family N-acetyltransferase n=1 Tax=Methylomonas sp. MK1 TaxID=1131552 RepID=UPI000475D57D|nr:GNAT family N-acetyltransferase [Methylomonas sp. MK1]
MMQSIDKIIENDDIVAVYPLMSILRPHLPDAAAFVAQVQRQAQAGYHLTGFRHNQQWQGLIGFRLGENLLYGKFLYVDDLVVEPPNQNGGIGKSLIEYVRKYALTFDCANLVLDTGLYMPYAQRFYYRQGLLAKGMHFVESLNGVSHA